MSGAPHALAFYDELGGSLLEPSFAGIGDLRLPHPKLVKLGQGCDMTKSLVTEGCLRQIEFS